MSDELIIGNLPLTDDMHGAPLLPQTGWAAGFVMTATKQVTRINCRFRLQFISRQWPLTFSFIEDRNPTAVDGPYLGPKRDGSCAGNIEISTPPNEQLIEGANLPNFAQTISWAIPPGVILEAGKRYWLCFQNRKSAPFKQWIVPEWYHQTVQVHATGPYASYYNDMRTKSTNPKTPPPTYIPDFIHQSDVGMAIFGQDP